MTSCWEELLKYGYFSGTKCYPTWKELVFDGFTFHLTEASIFPQVLLPLQTDPLISSLYRTPKTHRNSSPSRHNPKSSMTFQTSSYHIDVRSLTLKSFRDKIILPLFPRLHTLLSMPNRQDSFPENSGYQEPRLQQMLVA